MIQLNVTGPEWNKLVHYINSGNPRLKRPDCLESWVEMS